MERADTTFPVPLSHRPISAAPLPVKEEGRGPLGSGRNFLGEGRLEGLQALKEVAERLTHTAALCARL